MPWWSWVLIWVSLLACTLLVLVLGGVHIVRRGLALMREAGEALGQLAPASRAADGTAGGPAHDGVARPGSRVPGSAVFADPAAMRREYAEGRAQRRDARRDRRVERRRLRGQPQSLRDLGLI